MRDILTDLEDTNFLSDTDPVKRAQKSMRTPLPKRFYTAVSVGRKNAAFRILLDGRPVRTPGKAVVELPKQAAAQLIADEFEAQAEVIDPTTMPVFRLANTAIDGVASDPQAVLEDILRFSTSDLLCYRAGTPQGLVDRQAEAWDPVLEWAQATLGARFNLAEGVIHVEQPRESIAALSVHLGLRREPLRLAALHVMTTLTGSALLALAVETRELDTDAAWAAAHVDEDWQAEQWGHDWEAIARRSARRREFQAAVDLLAALGDT